MSTKKIVWHMDDGTIRVTTPAPKSRQSGETEEAWLTRVALRSQPPGAVSANVIEETELPPRRLRASWRSSGGKAVADLKEARKLLLAELRRERTLRLDDSDKEKIRLDEIGTADQRRALVAYRQALRDLPASARDDLALCATAEELAAWQPTWPTSPTTNAPAPVEVQQQ